MLQQKQKQIEKASAHLSPFAFLPLTPGGRLLAVCATLPQMLAALWLPLWRRERVIAGPCAERAEDLAELAALADAGILVPVIDRIYPLAQIAEAHEYVDGGHKLGSVIIEMTTD